MTDPVDPTQSAEAETPGAVTVPKPSPSPSDLDRGPVGEPVEVDRSRPPTWEDVDAEIERGKEASHSARSEAKNLRTRLRTAEGGLETLRRQIVESVVSTETQISTAAFWAAGTRLEDLLTEEGAVDADAVRQAASSAADQLGLIRSPAPNPAQGAGGSPVAAGPSWSDAFKGTKR